MGMLVDGKWQKGEIASSGKGGAFKRRPAQFRNWITADGAPGPSGAGGFKAESGRYHLYVSHACPWANRTTIFRTLKGLDEHIGLSVVHPDMLDMGWSFRTDFPGATGDPLNGAAHAHDIYLAADPSVTTRATVPILWDKAQKTIVSNESSEIIRMFNSAFDDITGDDQDFYPEALRPEIDALNDWIYPDINNGVYKSGFARTQDAYDPAVQAVFTGLSRVEGILTENRYLTGARITEADWRLFSTVLRFDLVYHMHFKCNRARIVDYPALWGWARELYQWPGVSGVVHFDHIVRHYHYSMESINPHRIIPINPVIDWDAPHDRGALQAE